MDFSEQVHIYKITFHNFQLMYFLLQNSCHLKQQQKKLVLTLPGERCKISPKDTSLILEKICFFGLKTRLSFTRVPADDYVYFFKIFFLAVKWPDPLSCKLA